MLAFFKDVFKITLEKIHLKLMLKELLMLSQQTIESVQSTIPLLAENGEAITRHFYGNLLTCLLYTSPSPRD